MTDSNEQTTAFPVDFLWGGATSNVQAEGGVTEGGKGLNVFDTVVVEATPGIPMVSTDSSVASDHYHRFREDIALLGELGMRAHRFSVVWSRIFPQGDESEPNAAGLEFYEDMVDELRAHGIEPVVSLLHFDMPDHLRTRFNGFAAREVVELHTRYVRAVVKRLGPKVRYWITANEINTAPFFPRVVAGSELPPGADLQEYQARLRHHTLLAQAHAALTVREFVPTAEIGAMVYYGPSYPASSRPSDVTGARFVNDLVYHLPLDVIVFGEYPGYYLRYLERRGLSAPAESGDADVLRAGAAENDFISFSYYQTGVTAAGEGDADNPAVEDGLVADFFTGKVLNPHLERNAWGWAIDPEGLRTAAVSLYGRYRKPVFVVENGIGLEEEPEDGASVQDHARIDYHRRHIIALEQAISIDGVPIIGYLAWSPFDILSSKREMRKRYGFIRVNRTHDDLRDLARSRKLSFGWYQEVIRTNGVSALRAEDVPG